MRHSVPQRCAADSCPVSYQDLCHQRAQRWRGQCIANVTYVWAEVGSHPDRLPMTCAAFGGGMTCLEGGFGAAHAFAARIGKVGSRLETDPTAVAHR